MVMPPPLSQPLPRPCATVPLGRRAVLAAGAAWAGGITRAEVSWPTGWVQPRPAAPALALTDTRDRTAPLPERLKGCVTLVQLVFTGCGDTCPIQGRLFSQMAARHRAKPAVHWLSISIDALSDDARRLRAWQAQIGPERAWQAGVPAARDVSALMQFLRGGPSGGDTHTTQVFGFDRYGLLAYRTGDSPPVALLDQLVDALR